MVADAHVLVVQALSILCFRIGKRHQGCVGCWKLLQGLERLVSKIDFAGVTWAAFGPLVFSIYRVRRMVKLNMNMYMQMLPRLTFKMMS